jgi:tetratricopeptide (TPR) repeat protein
VLQAMQRASALLQAGNFALARTTLEQVLQGAPRFVEAHRLLGGALIGLGDHAAAERALRGAIAIDPAWVPAQTSLAELLLNLGRPDEAEVALRAAIAAGRNHDHERAGFLFARLLNDTGRAEEALDVSSRCANPTRPDLDLLTQQAAALSALRRHDEAIALYRRILEAARGNPVAATNLAAALEAAGAYVEAETTARAAIASGATSAEAQFVHARSLIANNRFDEAQAALREAIARRPAFAEAHRNLAQLIWMRSADATAAAELLDVALARYPDDDILRVIKASLLDGAGDARAAHAVLAERTQRPGVAVDLLLTASQAALKFDPALALAHARRAAAAAPMHVLAQRLLVDALLATGEPQQSAELATRLLERSPNDQHLLAVQTTAWRILGDARYAQYCDYAAMARGWTIDTPPGWSDLPSYLRDLATSLKNLHGLQTHPLYQSLRHGSQTTQNLMYSRDPAIRAFFVAIDGPIRRHIAAIGRDGDDPLHRRNEGGYRIQGIWSVRLRSQGYHTNHVHPEGWLSSACYIELPRSMLAAGDPVRDARESTDAVAGAPASADLGKTSGWLKFGEPGIATRPPLAPAFLIRPQPGLLALFPSYFWHGTVPFTGDDTRLTIAFDIAPAST